MLQLENILSIPWQKKKRKKTEAASLFPLIVVENKEKLLKARFVIDLLTPLPMKWSPIKQPTSCVDILLAFCTYHYNTVICLDLFVTGRCCEHFNFNHVRVCVCANDTICVCTRWGVCECTHVQASKPPLFCLFVTFHSIVSPSPFDCCLFAALLTHMTFSLHCFPFDVKLFWECTPVNSYHVFTQHNYLLWLAELFFD